MIMLRVVKMDTIPNCSVSLELNNEGLTLHIQQELSKKRLNYTQCFLQTFIEKFSNNIKIIDSNITSDVTCTIKII